MWVPPENIDPVVLHAPTHKHVSVFGAVCAETGRLVARREQKFDALTFGAFLKQLLPHRRRNRRMIVIVDNARWHHAKLLKPWLAEHRDVLRLDFLPPYGPELNVIERVWKLTRRLCTHNQYFPTLEELIAAGFNQFDCWSVPNHMLHQLCAVN